MVHGFNFSNAALGIRGERMTKKLKTRRIGRADEGTMNPTVAAVPQSPSATLLPWMNEEKHITLAGILSNPNPLLSTWLDAHVEEVRDFLASNHRAYAITLSANPAAIPFLFRHPDLIDERGMLSNSDAWAMPYLQAAFARLSTSEFHSADLIHLSRNRNPVVMEWLERHNPLEKQNWYELSMNPCAIDLLLRHPTYIHWETFTRNPSPRAIQHMRENPDKMLLDPYAYIQLAHKNGAKEAGDLLLECGREDLFSLWAYRYGTLDQMNLDQIALASYQDMMENPNAISYVAEHPEKLVYGWSMSANPAIFQ
jgi:hypothetical protein